MVAVELVKKFRKLRHVHIADIDDQVKLKKGGVKDNSKGMSLWN